MMRGIGFNLDGCHRISREWTLAQIRLRPGSLRSGRHWSRAVSDVTEITAAEPGTIHILWTGPHEEVGRKQIGERWCFICRKRRQFEYVVLSPVLREDVPLEDQTGAYYGPIHHIECGTCHTVDGDCFPGTEREWSDG